MSRRSGCILAAIVVIAVLAGGAQWAWDSAAYGNATPLHRAVLHEDLSRVERLLARGADPNARMTAPARHGSEDSTALHLAATLQNARMVAALIAAGAETNAVDRQGRTALHLALAWFGGDGAAAELIRAGADVHAAWQDQTPLELALEYASFTTVQLLLDAGADPLKDIGPNAMACARGPDLLAKLQCLRRLGLSPRSATLLHTAARCDDVGAIDFLLDLGADLEAKDSDGTALIVASMAGAESAIRALVARGANPKAGTADFGSPLYAAAFGGRTGAVRLLLSLNLGLDLQAGRASDRATPLHFAYWHHDAEMIRMLLDAGADPEARTTHGRLPREFGR